MQSWNFIEKVDYPQIGTIVKNLNIPFDVLEFLVDRRGWICAAMRPAQAAPQSCAGAPRAVLRTQTLRLEMFQSAAQGIVLRPSERYGTHGHQVLS